MDSQERLNKMDDTVSYHPETPRLCANGCGYFGMAATRNLCSKCYGDFLKQELAKPALVQSLEKLDLNSTNSISSSPSMVQPSSESSTTTSVVALSAKNKCVCCKKKVGLLGFECRCGSVFCGMHRYPEAHSCTFDFKAVGRDALTKENPVCMSDKLQWRMN